MKEAILILQQELEQENLIQQEYEELKKKEGLKNE